MKKLKLLLLVFVFSPLSFLFANEGMWLPLLLESMNEKEMKSMGMKISAKDIYNINSGSLKDAIVSFGGFCTGEVISNQGLILTNHHCGYSAIQSHSTVEHNFLETGFWAMNHGQELPNAGLFATFIVRMEDVSNAALKGVTDIMDEKTRQSVIDKNLAQIRTTAKKNEWEDVMIRPFYEGNKYYLFITETYRDVRLVGAPPSSIGKFGADTDNWMWPRHTGDFSVFRIYADKNNRPAEYNAANVPYKPKKSLSISLDGVEEGDFTMVFGFPGRTYQYLPAIAVKQQAEILNPVKINIRDEALKQIDGFMRNDPKIKIQYASKFASTANAWKKWIGESQGLERTGGIEKKLAYEKEFQKRVDANPTFKQKYGTVLPQLNKLYADMESLALVRDHFNEVTRNTELFTVVGLMNTLNRTYINNGATGYTSEKEKILTRLNNFYADYNEKVDEAVFNVLMNIYFKNVPAQYIGDEAMALWKKQDESGEKLADHIYSKSRLVDQSKMKTMLEMPADEAIKTLSQDEALQFANSLIAKYSETITGKLNEQQSTINNLQRLYMQAQLDVFKDKRFYPDANSTLRLTYGKANGYQPRDAVKYEMYTDLDGLMEKYIPGDYEFDVPAKLIELHKAKDYGVYGKNGKMPVCFIGSNHTTGGNSGSPALDAYGNLVGLNFDRVWEGTMSDYSYDASICRNIMVDARFILFVIDKLGGAGHLIKEMKLVHPKKNQPKAKTAK